MSEQDALTQLPVNQIKVEPGFNPRQYFDEQSLNELVTSIRENGVIQPIVVRPNGEGYLIVAGERRWRACQVVGHTHIPAILKELDDKAALKLAITENRERDDVMPSEEAVAARRMLDYCQGDREGAAAELGWSMGQLNARLLLLHCSDKVMAALNERKILLGHAELLSSLPEKIQNGTIGAIIQDGISVSALRRKLESVALDLASAVFDKSDCEQCPNNTTQQSSLFDQNIGEGHCTNRFCFERRTQDHIKAHKAELCGDYEQVWLDVEKDPATYCMVLKHEVGASQFKQGCKSCANFGAVISTLPGNEGAVSGDLCFDKPCYRGKKKDHESMVARPKTPSSSKTTRVSTTAKKTKAKTKIKSAAAPKRVIERAEQLHREVARKEIGNDAKLVKVYSILALDNETTDSTARSKVLKAHKLSFSKNDDRGKRINLLYALDVSVLDELIVALSGVIAGQDDLSNFQGGKYLAGARASVKILGSDLREHFTVDKAYLELLVKSGIEALLEESGFKKWYVEQHDAKAYGQLTKLKRDPMIEAIAKAGYDFSGYVPDDMKLPV